MAWTFERIADGFAGGTGGLAWDGGGMLFSAVGDGKILRYDPKTGGTGILRRYTNRTNGLAFAPDGALYGCQESSRRVIHFADDGSSATTAFLIDGRYHNQPNSLAIDSKGRIWFSDPWSELRAYAILPDDTLGPHTVLHAFGRDHRGEHRGIEDMCVDREGNIVACAGWRKAGPGPLVVVFSASGAVVESHPVPADQPMNCAFGDADLASLYVTTAGGE